MSDAHRVTWFGGERPVEGATVYVKPPAPDVLELCGLLAQHEPHSWQLIIDQHQVLPRSEWDRRCNGAATPRRGES